MKREYALCNLVLGGNEEFKLLVEIPQYYNISLGRFFNKKDGKDLLTGKSVIFCSLSYSIYSSRSSLEKKMREIYNDGKLKKNCLFVNGRKSLTIEEVADMLENMSDDEAKKYVDKVKATLVDYDKYIDAFVNEKREETVNNRKTRQNLIKQKRRVRKQK